MIDVILDVDTGVDDAMALLLAARSPALNLIGVTCVSGNVDIEHVVPNTLKVLNVAEANNVPVARGMALPLLESFYSASGVHGNEGLGGIDLPLPNRQEVPEHAVEFLRRTLLEAEKPITLVPLAPLTNIAALLTQYPEVKDKIAQLVIMGGSVGMGNASATAEFNVRQDPEAADIVFTAGLPTVMYGLDVFREVNFNRSEAEAFAQSDKPSAKLAGQLLLFFMDNFGREMAGIGDAGCVASVIAPDGLTTEDRPMRVELNGKWTRGQTVVDMRPRRTIERESEWQPPMGTSISVALDVDREGYRQIFSEAVLS